jgi:hypothetical protein
MLYRNRYRIPELLALLSAQPQKGRGLWPLNPAKGQLRQMARLAREGIREYGRKLDALERDLRHDSWWEEPAEPYRSDSEQADESCDRRDEEAERDCDKPLPLTQAEIHHIFERLAIRRRPLNRRGYPFTSEVTEEQERLFRGSELLLREEVEEAWDDWENEDGKRLYRRYREERDDGGERCDEARVERDRDRDRDRGDSRLARLTQEQFEAIFRKLRRAERELNRGAYPFTADVHEEQRESFKRACMATPSEVERAFERWTGARDYRRWLRGKNRPTMENRKAESNGGRPPRKAESRPERDARAAFRVFDEMLLNEETRASEFTTDHGPSLDAVNRRLSERGHCELDEVALQCEWVEYLVIAARTRDDSHRSREANGHGEPSEINVLYEEVKAGESDFKADQTEGHPPAERRNGRKRIAE